MRKIVAVNVDETDCLDSAEILDILGEGELIENAVGDPCSICGGPCGYIPIQDDFDVTFWICDRCDASGEWS